jgi:hypothetical protein
MKAGSEEKVAREKVVKWGENGERKEAGNWGGGGLNTYRYSNIFGIFHIMRASRARVVNHTGVNHSHLEQRSRRRTMGQCGTVTPTLAMCCNRFHHKRSTPRTTTTTEFGRRLSRRSEECATRSEVRASIRKTQDLGMPWMIIGRSAELMRYG